MRGAAVIVVEKRFTTEITEVTERTKKKGLHEWARIDTNANCPLLLSQRRGCR